MADLRSEWEKGAQASLTLSCQRVGPLASAALGSSRLNLAWRGSESFRADLRASLAMDPEKVLFLYGADEGKAAKAQQGDCFVASFQSALESLSATASGTRPDPDEFPGYIKKFAHDPESGKPNRLQVNMYLTADAAAVAELQAGLRLRLTPPTSGLASRAPPPSSMRRPPGAQDVLVPPASQQTEELQEVEFRKIGSDTRDLDKGFVASAVLKFMPMGSDGRGYIRPKADVQPAELRGNGRPSTLEEDDKRNLPAADVKRGRLCYIAAAAAAGYVISEQLRAGSVYPNGPIEKDYLPHCHEYAKPYKPLLEPCEVIQAVLNYPAKNYRPPKIKVSEGMKAEAAQVILEQAPYVPALDKAFPILGGILAGKRRKGTVLDEDKLQNLAMVMEDDDVDGRVTKFLLLGTASSREHACQLMEQQPCPMQLDEFCRARYCDKGLVQPRDECGPEENIAAKEGACSKEADEGRKRPASEDRIGSDEAEEEQGGNKEGRSSSQDAGASEEAGTRLPNDGKKPAAGKRLNENLSGLLDGDEDDDVPVGQLTGVVSSRPPAASRARRGAPAGRPALKARQHQAQQPKAQRPKAQEPKAQEPKAQPKAQQRQDKRQKP